MGWSDMKILNKMEWQMQVGSLLKKPNFESNKTFFLQ